MAIVLGSVDAAIVFVSACLLEYALSFDVSLAIREQCDHLAIPEHQQARARRWALASALVARLVILTAAVHLARSHTSASYVFGAMVLASAVLMYRGSAAGPPSAGPPSWRCGRHTDLASIVLGQLALVPDSLAIVAIGDSILALLGGSILATIAAHRVPPSIVERLHVPHYALGTLLAFVGLELLVQPCISPAIMLVAITGLVAAAVAESLAGNHHDAHRP